MSGDPLYSDKTRERKQFLPEIKVKGKMEERTEWRGQNENQIEGEEKWKTCWCCGDQQSACRMVQASAEKLKHTELAEKKRWPQCYRESSWQVRQSRLCQKGKEQNRLSRAPDRKEGIQCQRSKKNSSNRKKKKPVFLCRRTVRVKVKSKVIPTSFLKIE